MHFLPDCALQTALPGQYSDLQQPPFIRKAAGEHVLQAPLALLVQYASLCAESAMHTPLSGYMPASLQRVQYLLPSMVIPHSAHSLPTVHSATHLALSLVTTKDSRTLPGLHCWQPFGSPFLQTAHDSVHGAHVPELL